MGRPWGEKSIKCDQTTKQGTDIEEAGRKMIEKQLVFNVFKGVGRDEKV